MHCSSYFKSWQLTTEFSTWLRISWSKYFPLERLVEIPNVFFIFVVIVIFVGVFLPSIYSGAPWVTESTITKKLVTVICYSLFHFNSSTSLFSHYCSTSQFHFDCSTITVPLPLFHFNCSTITAPPLLFHLTVPL